MQDWIMNELRAVNLGDKRLDARYAIVLDRLSQKPGASIPAACNGWAETQAAYRFLDNGKVEPSELLAPHREATECRAAEQPVVLVVQDTTEIDLTRDAETVGGPLSDSHRRGMLTHVVWAVTPDRVPLGVLDADIWARDEAGFGKRRERRALPIEQKESSRWLEGYRTACQTARKCTQTQVISVADSEADIYECHAEGFVTGDDGYGRWTGYSPSGERVAEWLVRAYHDRCLQDPRGAKLFDTVARAPVRQYNTIAVRRRKAISGDGRKRRGARDDREALVAIRTCEVVLRPPHRSDRKLPPLRVRAVLVREESPPEGESPIEWLLLTTLPIDTAADIERIITYYCARWEIEIFFRVLKSGCRVEELQLETAERMASCVAVYLIVAWRVLRVTMLGRESPELPCDSLLTEDEWQSVYTIVRGSPPPDEPPPLGQMIRLIASLGGHLGRKGDGPPGPTAMWIGMQRMRDFATCWRAFGPKVHPQADHANLNKRCV